MKEYENRYRQQLTESTTIVRLDGHSFSKFTRSFDQPYDVRFRMAMVETCKDILAQHPDCSTAYTQCDEITLVFPRGFQQFGARTDKYLSLLAALTSVKFSHHLAAQPDV